MEQQPPGLRDAPDSVDTASQEDTGPEMLLRRRPHEGQLAWNTVGQYAYGTSLRLPQGYMDKLCTPGTIAAILATACRDLPPGVSTESLAKVLRPLARGSRSVRLGRSSTTMQVAMCTNGTALASGAWSFNVLKTATFSAHASAVAASCQKGATTATTAAGTLGESAVTWVEVDMPRLVWASFGGRQIRLVADPNDVWQKAAGMGLLRDGAEETTLGDCLEAFLFLHLAQALACSLQGESAPQLTHGVWGEVAGVFVELIRPRALAPAIVKLVDHCGAGHVDTIGGEGHVRWKRGVLGLADMGIPAHVLSTPLARLACASARSWAICSSF